MICLATVAACGLNKASVRTMKSVWRGDKEPKLLLFKCTSSLSCYFIFHSRLDSCLKMLVKVKADQGWKCLSEEALLSPEPCHLRIHPPCENSYIDRQVEYRSLITIRGANGWTCLSELQWRHTQQHIFLNFAWPQRKLYTYVVFQKYFILISIQVQGNKITRIYLTGHGNETVKVLFCWATLFLDKDMQVITGGGLQK